MVLKERRKSFDNYALIPEKDSDSIYEPIHSNPFFKYSSKRDILAPFNMVTFEPRSFMSENVLKDYIEISFDEPISRISSKNSIDMFVDVAKSLLALKDNWDGEGAEKISTTTFQNSITFFKNYFEFISNYLKQELFLPEISAVPDGSIDLYWKTKQARMLINIGNNSAKYYGDQYDDRNSIRGEVEINEVQPFLAYWMNNLAK